MTSLRYFFPWVGASQSPLKKIEEARTLIAQAFGRNSFPDEKLKDSILVTDASDEEKARYCRERMFDPGRPNCLIAEAIEGLDGRFAFERIFIQWEIFFSLSAEWLMKNARKLVIIWPNEEYFNTKMVLEKILSHGARKSERPLMICHKGALLRTALIWEKLTGNFPLLPYEQVDCFDEKSVQPWTRSAKNFYPREILVRIHHLIKGWI